MGDFGGFRQRQLEPGELADTVFIFEYRNSIYRISRDGKIIRINGEFTGIPPGHTSLSAGSSPSSSLSSISSNSSIRTRRKILTTTQYYTVRDGMGICATPSRIYFSGGNVGNIHFNDLQYIELKTFQWTSTNISKKPRARTEHVMLSYDTSIVIFGGKFLSRALDDICIYTDRWMEVSPKNSIRIQPRYRHAGIIHDGQLLIFGGTDGQQTFNDIWSFNFAQKIWNKIKDTGVSTVSKFSSVNDKKWYISGGDKIVTINLDNFDVTINETSGYVFRNFFFTEKKAGSDIKLLHRLSDPSLPVLKRTRNDGDNEKIKNELYYQLQKNEALSLRVKELEKLVEENIPEKDKNSEIIELKKEIEQWSSETMELQRIGEEVISDLNDKYNKLLSDYNTLLEKYERMGGESDHKNYL